MRISLLFLLTLLIASCELPNDRQAYIKLTAVGFSPATTATVGGNPEQANGAIPADNFAIQFYFEYEQSGDGDPYEDGIIDLNPMTSFKVWSPQTVSGRAPNSSLNTLFNAQYFGQTNHLQEDYPLPFDAHVQSIEEQYPPKIGYLLTTGTNILPGTYDFYFRCEFKDGTVILDNLMDVVIE